MPIPAIVYAGAYAAGTLGGTFLGTAIAKALLPNNKPSRSSWTQTSYFDMSKELERLGVYSF